ncbi:MAG TPA: VWA domain-containing protein [Pyrinomonadaceae bacterium]|jgi:VWFA-related protein
MSSRLTSLFFGLLFCAGAAALPCSAQSVETSPAAQQPTPAAQEQDQDSVKVFTEEVRLPIFAYDDNGRFDPTLELEDLLVLEDGVPQEVKSLRHVPASILLLLCTSGDLNPMMRTSTTRDVALKLVAALRTGDQFSVLQFNSRVELLQDWTTDKSAVEHVLKTKLHSGRGTRLSEAVRKAIEQLQSRPVGNRHLLIVTDGVDVPAWADDRELMKALAIEGAQSQQAQAAFREAVKQLMAAQATVHVVNYRSLLDPAVAGERNPGSMTFTGRGFRFDPAMKRLHKAYLKAMQKSAEQLSRLVEETGGRMWLPSSAEEMIAEGSAIARDIGSQYVITYRPKRPLAAAATGEYRSINIAPRRLGLHLRTRRGYIVNRAS